MECFRTLPADNQSEFLFFPITVGIVPITYHSALLAFTPAISISLQPTAYFDRLLGRRSGIGLRG